MHITVDKEVNSFLQALRVQDDNYEKMVYSLFSTSIITAYNNIFIKIADHGIKRGNKVYSFLFQVQINNCFSREPILQLEFLSNLIDIYAMFIKDFICTQLIVSFSNLKSKHLLTKQVYRKAPEEGTFDIFTSNLKFAFIFCILLGSI